jgi:drug/metabolite transporter (DMT)-like permease
MKLNRTILFAAGFAVIAVICWSGNWVLGRAVRADIPPIGLSFWRWTVAVIILFPVALRGKPADWRALREGWKIVAALSFLGAAVFQSMVYIGLHSTQATNALLLNATAPLYVIVIAWLILGNRVNARQMVGISISFIGASILVSRGELATLLHLQFNIGDLWIIGALVIWGLYSVLLRFKPKAMSSLMLVFFIAVGGVIFLTPFYIWETVSGQPMHLNMPTVWSVLYTGIFASVVAFITFNEAVARIGPSKAVYFLHLMPVFGAVFSFIFLGERLEFYHMVGFPIALGGVLMATIIPDTQRAPLEPKPGR